DHSKQMGNNKQQQAHPPKRAAGKLRSRLGHFFFYGGHLPAIKEIPHPNPYHQQGEGNVRRRGEKNIDLHLAPPFRRSPWRSIAAWAATEVACSAPAEEAGRPGDSTCPDLREPA